MCDGSGRTKGERGYVKDALNPSKQAGNPSNKGRDKTKYMR